MLGVKLKKITEHFQRLNLGAFFRGGEGLKVVSLPVFHSQVKFYFFLVKNESNPLELVENLQLQE